MKKMYKLLTVVSLFLLSVITIGCGSGTDKVNELQDINGKQEKLDTTDLKYRFVGNNCETSPRSFNSKDDMCFNLQLDINNNNCAAEAREYFFKKICSDHVWNPTAATAKLDGTRGARVSCVLSEGEPTEQELSLGVAYAIKQDSIAENLLLQHEHVRAIVNQAYFLDSKDESKNKVEIFISLYNMSGRLIASRSKTFKHGEAFTEVSLTANEKYKPKIVCTPKLQ